MGLCGAIPTAYVLLVGGDLNGPVIGAIFSVVGFAAYGKHVRNIWPIMAGVFLAAILKNWTVTDPAALLAALGVGLWKGGDQALIDGALVNGSWKLVGWVSGMVRRLQTGYVYHYALVMLLGIFVLMTYFVWLNK